VIPKTGHLGSLTRPTAFAEIVHRFVHEISAERAREEQMMNVEAHPTDDRPFRGNGRSRSD
jgi:hypothetical protein